MLRPTYLLVAGLALLTGVILARAGAAGTQNNVADTQRMAQLRERVEALSQEMRLLRQEIEDLKRSLPKPFSHDDDMLKTSDQEPGQGRVTKIDAADSTLVEVNLGKEAGLEKHNTLEIFRPGTLPEFIGTLRIFEVYNERALCRLVSTNPLKKHVLRVGDQVHLSVKTASP